MQADDQPDGREADVDGVDPGLRELLAQRGAVQQPLHDRRGAEVAQELGGERGDEDERGGVGRACAGSGGQDHGGPDGEPRAAEEAQQAHGAHLAPEHVGEVGDHQRGHDGHGHQRGRDREEERHERELARHGESAAGVELGPQGDDEGDQAARRRERMGERRRRRRDEQRERGEHEAAADDRLGPALGRGERLGVALQRLGHALLLSQCRVESHQQRNRRTARDLSAGGAAPPRRRVLARPHLAIRPVPGRKGLRPARLRPMESATGRRQGQTRREAGTQSQGSRAARDGLAAETGHRALGERAAVRTTPRKVPPTCPQS